MLSGDDRRWSPDVLPQAPFCPMLTQGWNLLRAYHVQLPDVLAEASQFLANSLWSTFTSRRGASSSTPSDPENSDETALRPWPGTGWQEVSGVGEDLDRDAAAGFRGRGHPLPRSAQRRLSILWRCARRESRQVQAPAAEEHHPEGRDAEVSPYDEFLRSSFKDMQHSARISDDDVAEEAGPIPATEKGIQNWRLTQAIARLLDKRFGNVASHTIETFLRDVYLYVTDRNAAKEINAIVAAELTDEPTVVVGHSLGHGRRVQGPAGARRKGEAAPLRHGRLAARHPDNRQPPRRAPLPPGGPRLVQRVFQRRHRRTQSARRIPTSRRRPRSPITTAFRTTPTINMVSLDTSTTRQSRSASPRRCPRNDVTIDRYHRLAVR